MAQLTDGDYEILLTQENVIETVAKQGTVRNVSYQFLDRFRSIYQNYLNQPVNVNCSDCVRNAFFRIWPLMEEKRIERQRMREDEIIQQTIKERDNKVKISSNGKK